MATRNVQAKHKYLINLLYLLSYLLSLRLFSLQTSIFSREKTYIQLIKNIFI